MDDVKQVLLTLTLTVEELGCLAGCLGFIINTVPVAARDLKLPELKDKLYRQAGEPEP